MNLRSVIPKTRYATKLQLGFPLGGNFTTLPMSGHYRLVSGLDANYRQEISGVSMLRAVARVDVLVGGITNFELTSIQAYRVNSRIQLIGESGSSCCYRSKYSGE